VIIFITSWFTCAYEWHVYTSLLSDDTVQYQRIYRYCCPYNSSELELILEFVFSAAVMLCCVTGYWNMF